MKTIGLIGGISWHSTSWYYAEMNRRVAARCGIHHSAKILMYSVNYAEYRALQVENDWDAIAEMLSAIALRLEKAGADMVLISCNTAHWVAPQIQATLSVPFLHIGDVTADAILKQGCTRVGLLGSSYTMEHDFIKERFRAKGIETLIPNSEDRKQLHEALIQELAQGIFKPETKDLFLRVIQSLKEQGAELIVLGCTEIGLLIQPSDTDMILIDTAVVHCEAAVEAALG